MPLNAMKEWDSKNPTPTLDKEPFFLHIRYESFVSYGIPQPKISGRFSTKEVSSAYYSTYLQFYTVHFKQSLGSHLIFLFFAGQDHVNTHKHDTDAQYVLGI